ncbi:MAG: OmpH family outer membrane protein [Rhodobacteraceae bacterium]|nr:OmpH family outer membrane protein [Paracoccaceae bacterium]
MMALTALAATRTPATAQTAPAGNVAASIAAIDQERLFNDSAWGKRVAVEIADISANLAVENRRIEAELTAEEKSLTERRASLQSDLFRAEAEAFDQKVTQIRQEQDAKLRDIGKKHDAEKQAFYRAILPVMGRLLNERGAVVVLDSRAIVLAAENIDVTDELIAKIDNELGDGGGGSGAASADGAN